jgi:hypothetical protein
LKFIALIVKSHEIVEIHRASLKYIKNASFDFLFIVLPPLDMVRLDEFKKIKIFP